MNQKPITCECGNKTFRVYDLGYSKAVSTELGVLQVDDYFHPVEVDSIICEKCGAENKKKFNEFIYKNIYTTS